MNKKINSLNHKHVRALENVLVRPDAFLFTTSQTRSFKLIY